jgi:type IV pilus assembly protein PilE
MQKTRAAQGFTLIEAMITVAIIAIVAAVAYPSYTEHLRKSRRADAQSLLMNVATRQQQFLLDTRAYADTLGALQVTPPASVTPHYTVTLAVAASPVPTFTVSAAPHGAQAADKCGTLTLDQAGIKSPGGCW